MANPDHVDRLRSGVELWNAWRADWHLTPDLRDANLELVQAVGADLSGCDCRGANLFGARLTRANLQHSSFEGAVLRQTFLAEARLDGATFDYADLGNSEMKSCQALGAIEQPRYDRTFSTTFRRASLKGCYVDEATLVSVDFADADLRNARLNGTTFRRANFTGAD